MVCTNWFNNEYEEMLALGYRLWAGSREFAYFYF